MVASFRDLLGIRPGTASTSDSALIIIDAQNEYAQGQLKVTNAESSGKAIASLLEKYRAAGGKIVHVMHQTPEGAPIFTPGTELANEFSNVAAKVRSARLHLSGHEADSGSGRRGDNMEAVPWLFRADISA